MRYIKRILSWVLCVCMVLSLAVGVQIPTQAANYDAKIRISCVGDSITYGLNSSGNEKTYPSQLQKLLGDNYVVSKYGACGAFACESKDVCWYPYITSSDYTDSLTSNPDIVIIMLGTNDAAESMCWGKRNQGVDIQKYFREGYENLINTYLNLPSKPQIILATPVTVSRNTHAQDGDPSENDHRQTNNNEGTIPIIKDLAAKYNLPLVDMQSYTTGWTCDNYLSDGLHPNDAGYALLAEKFKEAVLNEVTKDAIRVTCVGDSITDGYKASNGEHTYPAQLQKILGDHYKVFNAGVSGRTVIRSSDQAYSTTDRYKQGLASQPDKVIIMLGTNDAVLSGITTEEKKAEFKRDYEALIKEYQNCGTNPEIMLALQTTCEADDRNGHNEDILIPIIRSIAEEYNLQVLDAHEYTSSWTNNDYLADGLHPNDAGYERLAQYFASHIKGTANNILSNREYRIISKHSGKAFAIENASKENSAKLCQMSRAEDDSQLWILEATDDGFYRIVNKASGKALDIPGGSTKLETEIIQYTKNDGDNQKWFIEEAGDGSYRITPKIAMTLALDVKARSVDDGAPIIQWTYGGDNNQKWEFELVEQVITQEPVEAGATYSIKSAMNQKFVLMPQNSRPGWTNIVLYDDTQSNSQKWLVNQDGDNYNLKNVGTDLSLHYGEGVKDAHVDQNGFDNSDFYKWNLIRINSGDYTGGYMIEAVRKDGEGKPVYLTADTSKREVELYLRSENKNNPASQIWCFEKTANVENAAITPDKVEEISQAFLDKFYVDTKQSDGSTRKSLGGGFWVGAELMEIMLDGYQTTGDNRYREVFESSYLDELDNIGNRFSYWTEMTETDWEGNPYNDDVMWLTMASARAYFLFGNGDTEFTNYLSNAKNNFDMVYKRGLKADGTIIWCQEPDKNEGTTSCINGPATVAACYLAKATGDTSYYEKAKNIHKAQRDMLFDAKTGRVLDSPGNGWASTYNQGTWIGACVLLYEYYHDQEYMDDAIKAMNFVLERNGSFSDEYGILKSEDATTGGDLPVFRSILMRYVRMMIVEFGSKADMTPYIEWMQKNARVAYNNQNIHGLIQTPFNKAVPNDVAYEAPGMSGAVSLMLNLPTFDNTVVRDGFERIEAEEFDYVKGVMTEKTSDADGNRQVAGTLNDYYTAYSNVDFGNVEANQVELRVSTASAGSYVEVRLDSLDGELLGKVELPNTEDWNKFATVSADIKPVSGSHTIYLVYKNNASASVCNLNWFKFKVASVELQVNKNYAFVSKNSGKAMTIEGYSAENAAKLCQMPMSNYESQVWTLQDAGDGYYYIVNKFSQKVLNVPEASTEQGTIIEQAEKTDADSQKWKLEVTKDGFYCIIPKLAEKQALDVSGASQNDGAYILQWTYNGDDNQKWQLVDMEEVVENPESGEQIRPDEQCIVSFDLNDGTSAMSQSVEKGTVIQQPENPTREGYTFEGWYLEDTIYDFSAPVTDNITLKAKWTENNENDVPNKPTEGTTYTITFDSVGGSQADDQSVKAGETAVKPADPSKEGYTFAGWYLGEIKYDFETPVTENLTLVAKWTEVSTKDTKYTVTFNSNGGTTVTNQSIKANGKVARPIDPVKEGYKFMGWYLGETKYDFNTSVTKNLVLDAEWEADDLQNPPVEQKYSVTFDSDGGSVVANQTVKEGERAKNPEQPIREGYTFKGWYLDGVEYDFATEVTKNITLKAQWEKKTQDNSGSDNTGNENSGNENSGNENSGNENSGNENTGSENSGSDNTGNDNTGSENTGNENSGSDNTGSENTGKENSGSENTGKDNTGSENTGNENNSGTPSDDEFKVGVTFEKGKLLYEITKSTATGLEVQVVKPLKKTNSSISIPMQVTYKGKKCKVTSIAKNAFKNNTKLTKVTIAKNVITIGEKAFYNCKKLSKVTFKMNNLKSVGKSAFLKTAKNLNIKTGSKNNIKKYEKLFKKKIPSHAKITK